MQRDSHPGRAILFAARLGDLRIQTNWNVTLRGLTPCWRE